MDTLLCLAGYEFYPEERVSAYIKEISELTQRLGLSPVKSAGSISAYEMMKTVQKPSTEPYWKLRYKGASEDIFFLTINDKIESMIKTMFDTAGTGGYAATDLGVYIQPVVQGTSVHCEFNLFYNPEDVAEVRSIANLSGTSTRALLNKGAFFSRPYGENTGLIVNRDAASVAILKKLKNIFDPNHIMNPGKVCW
jgi:FAD/FMN-containing dehydrogenase